MKPARDAATEAHFVRARRRALMTGLALGAFALAVAAWTMFAVGAQVFAGRDL